MESFEKLYLEMIGKGWNFMYPICVSVHNYDTQSVSEYPHCVTTLTGRLNKMIENELEVLGRGCDKPSELKVPGLENMQLAILNRSDCILIGDGIILRIR